VQMRPDHMPPGLIDRAKSMNIELVNVAIEQVPDIYVAAKQLATAAGDAAAGEKLAKTISDQIESVRASTAGKAKVRTLIVLDADGKGVVGRGTFLNDLLEAAGGENVLPPDGPHWPTIDRETLASLKPDVILQLLPGASPQVLEQAKNNWNTLPNLPAVKNGRIYPITEWFTLQPGAHVGETAKLFAERINPKK
jgi:iron complex transport system substrate-binding protein